ncbi:GspH/FimT family pseudopilin [Acidovorax sp. NCPPB 2350]|nr:GspH/FimT family pseudopilin [Acidovorax sp. NCPPB 2350]
MAKDHSRGFTLIELMVTLAILSILAMVAAPNFGDIKRNSELTSIANSYLAALNTARFEGMKRNTNALIVPANGDTNWGQGWMIFVDMDMNNKYNAGDILIQKFDAPPNYIGITPSSGGTAAETPLSYILYDGSGFAKTSSGGFGANTVQFARTDVASTQYSQIRRVKISASGRVRICTPTSDADSTCSAVRD